MITVKVDARNATPIKKELVTTGSIGIPVKFIFSADWNGLGKTAVFSDGTVTKDVVLTTNECVIPHECLVTEGALLTLGIYGTNGDDVVIPTIECPLARINQGTEPSDDPSIEPTPSAVNQILAAAQNAVDVAQSVRDDADDGLFDGEDGDDGVSPSVTITEVSGGHSVKITDKEHPLGQTFTVADGANGTDGEDGTDGDDGFSPDVAISEITGGHRITITDLLHPEGQIFDVMNGADGADGTDGEDGVNGVGIASIAKTSTSGNIDTYTITLTNGSTSTFTVTNGNDGVDGQDGEDGNGIASVVLNADYTLTITLTDGTSYTTTSIRGAQGAPGADGQDGAPGADGEDGYSPTVSVETITGGHSVTITDAEHPDGQTFNVMDGENGTDGQDGTPGTDGQDGEDGFSPTVTVTEISGGHRVTITDAEGDHVFDVMDGTGGGGGTSDFDALSNRPKYNGTAMTHSTDIPEVKTATWDGKQDAISDLSTIRSGASAGASAYQKPSSGVPKTDLSSGVQSSLEKADSAVQQAGLNAAVSPLQAQIDAITAQSDVVDVVGTYTELQAYSKPLYVDDIVKVLDDSTHGNARSYYRWNGTSWTYIGSEAVSYTKAETDTLLAGKGTYSKPSGGIPKTDFASAVQASLGKADSAVQPGDLASVATTGSYNSLSNKPTIPTDLSQLSADSTHRLVSDTEKSTWNGKQNALGFTPYNSTNPAGYQTAAQVSAAVSAAIPQSCLVTLKTWTGGDV